MSGNKMLIDASHPEETRVAVVRGNRIEDYDFESQEKRQLRGNIYLAKVTRVEPSLQAAFIDYGGNRHGFLAFSEIHPDYYQIPVADRQALLEEEAAQARANREADEADLETAEVAELEPSEPAVDAAEEKPKKKPRRKTRAPKKAKETESAAETDNEEAKAANADEATPETGEQAESSSEVESDEGEEDGSTTMAASVDTDSISEPLPGDDDGEDNFDDDQPASDAAAGTSDEPKKNNRRTTRRKTSRKRAEVEASEESDDTSQEDEAEKPAVSKDEVEATEADTEDQADDKPRKQRSRRRRTAKDSDSQEADSKKDETSPATESIDDDETVESVGQEDAMEEVPERRRNRRQYKIQEVIKRRQVMLVQVVKEERGNKGAALTTYLSLAGRYSVLMPNTARGGGISRKISNTNDRKRLKAIATELDVPEGMGVILRTAGASRTKVEIQRDFEYLMRVWDRVRALTLSSAAPCLVHEEGNLVKRSIRDLYDKDTAEIIVAGRAAYTEAREFMDMLIPSHVSKIKHYDQSQNIFSKFGVESQLERMLSPEVTLKSGGYLVINQTEALVAIDVNSGRATREHSIEDTALKTNMEAAEEVARQLRLRDLAGLIVIDFIDMEERRNNRSVEKKLKDCLKNDRARIQLGRISHFGLMEMSRQRIRVSVLESTMNVCPHCGGQGHVRSDSAIALHVFRGIEDHVSRHNRFNVTVRTTPEIAIQLLNSKRQALTDLEERYGLLISIVGDQAIKGQEFVIEKGAATTGATSLPDTAEEPENSEEEAGGRKKRRRRKGKQAHDANDDADTDAEADPSDAENETDSDEVEASESEGDDTGGKSRRRRRGTRGGRKNRPQQDTSQESSDDGNKPAARTAKEPSGSSSESQDGEPDDSKSSRRTTRRKTTAKSKEPALEAKGSADTIQGETLDKDLTKDVKTANDNVISQADERPGRSRNTRRPRKSKTEEAGEETSKGGLWGGGTGDFF